MKIGVLGGSFDPPHIGHSLIAQQIQEIYSLDEIWLMPTFRHPFEKKTESSDHRLAMTKFLENKFIKTSTIEIDQKQVSYTIDTVRKLTKKYPDHSFYWIIGSDQLAQVKKWKDWKELFKTSQFIVFPRPYEKENMEEVVKEAFGLDAVPGNIQLVPVKDVVLIDISSTKVRNRVKSGKSIHYMVDPQVESYIKKEKLYK
jgi:nicotinate-nucleotide adenylyltransferase